MSEGWPGFTTLILQTRPLRLYLFLLLVSHGPLDSQSFEIARYRTPSRPSPSFGSMLASQHPSIRPQPRRLGPELLFSIILSVTAARQANSGVPGANVKGMQPGTISGALKESLSRLRDGPTPSVAWRSEKRRSWSLNPNHSSLEGDSDALPSRENYRESEPELPGINAVEPEVEEELPIEADLNDDSPFKTSKTEYPLNTPSASSASSSDSASPQLSPTSSATTSPPSPSVSFAVVDSGSPSSASSSSSSASTSSSTSSSSSSSSLDSSSLPFFSPLSSADSGNYESFPATEKFGGTDYNRLVVEDAYSLPKSHRECDPKFAQTYCLNGGRCLVMTLFESEICECPTGFKGQRCQEIDHDQMLDEFAEPPDYEYDSFWKRRKRRKEEKVPIRTDDKQNSRTRTSIAYRSSRVHLIPKATSRW